MYYFASIVDSVGVTAIEKFQINLKLSQSNLVAEKKKESEQREQVTIVTVQDTHNYATSK